ncbi:MAG: host attachment protein, partial [Planctomycetaceae bacterium]|nr:host attachment protein [Planctomycetaceae bacterium]
LSGDWPNPSEWNEIVDLVHSESSLKAGEINTDGPGTFGTVAGGHHGGQPQVDFKHQTAEHFAEEIIGHLEVGRQKNKFGKLALICPPLFLGVIRKKLPEPLHNLITLELDKDYTHMPIKELTSILNESLIE